MLTWCTSCKTLGECQTHTLIFYHMTRWQRSHEIARRLRKSLHDLRLTRYFNTNSWSLIFLRLKPFGTRIAGEVNV